MNERIQELALAAGKYADETQPRGSYTRDGMWLYAYNEKFAELIVRECCEVINAAKPGVVQVPAEVALDMATKNVKSYFGVE